MKRSLLAAVLIVASGCATAAETSHSPNRATTRFITIDEIVHIESVDARKSSERLEVPRERVWTAVLQSYPELGLTVSAIDSEAGLVGVLDQRVRTIDGRSVANYFNCGGDFGNNASSFDVFVTVRTQISAQGANGTLMRTDAVAHAKSLTHRTEVNCLSKGNLERKIADEIRKRSASTG
jgi:hypothetical protein